MKTKYLSLFAALAAIFTFASCEENLDPVKDDAVITVSPDRINASWEGVIAELNVTANCAWKVSKTDSEGSAVDWVKCDLTSGNGDSKLNVKVEKNESANERVATVTVYSGDVKAFVDVKQEANPNPSTEPEPEPEPQLLELSFNFVQALEGWPNVGKGADWSGLKNCDSGGASDNGGTATENSHRRAQVTYTIDGTGYDFTLADPNGAENHNIYHDSSKGLYSGTLRYFGIPAIQGKKIVKIEMVQGASNKDPEKFTRNVGVAKWVCHKDVAIDQIQYVEGGEPQNQAVTDGTVYTYELSGTAGNTVYWLNSPTNASIIVSLKLYYADADGTEEPLGPEPADPQPQEPDPGTDPGTDPATPDADALTLTFDFTGQPFEGWPTAAKYTHEEGGIECKYPLNGVDYIFVPADCGTASAGQAFWQPPVDDKPGYFAFNAQYRYLGLPALEGYALIKVECHNVQLGSVTAAAKIGITSLINATAAHPAESAYVSGGALQTWETEWGKTYTYNLGGTTANTRYYIYAYAKGAVDTITLTYNPVK